MIPGKKELELIQIYMYICDLYDQELKYYCQRYSSNSNPAFTDQEIMTIYLFAGHCQKDFPHTVSYNRFVELQHKVGVPPAVFVKMMCTGKCTGISFIDSTPFRSCHIKREKQHRTFKGIAEKDQCSIGWFYGFKLHLIINDKGEILDFILTPDNVDDREPLKNMDLHKRVFGKLYGDKGYISKDLSE